MKDFAKLPRKHLWLRFMIGNSVMKELRIVYASFNSPRYSKTNDYNGALLAI